MTRQTTPIRVLEWDIWMVLTSALHILLTGVNIFAASVISDSARTADAIIAIVAIAAATLLFGYISESLGHMIGMRSDIRLRRLLMMVTGVASSRANNDVPLAIGGVLFYISAPGAIVSIMIYLVFLIDRSPVVTTFLVAALTLAAWPLYRYYRWRTERISRIRAARNRLLDEHGTDAAQYATLLGEYERHYTDFWRWDVGLGAIPVLMVAASFAVIIAVSPTSQQALAAFIVYALLADQIKSLFLSYTVFQENKRSMNAIDDDLNAQRDV